MFNVKRGESLVASLFYIDKSIVLSLFGYLKQQLQHETLNAYNSGSRRARAILTADLESHTSHADGMRVPMFNGHPQCGMRV